MSVPNPEQEKIIISYKVDPYTGKEIEDGVFRLESRIESGGITKRGHSEIMRAFCHACTFWQGNQQELDTTRCTGWTENPQKKSSPGNFDFGTKGNYKC